MKNLIIILTLFTFCSCSSKSISEQGRSIEGTIFKDKFINDYLTIDIPEGWAEFSKTDNSQFLVISKESIESKPSIILLALNKKKFKEEYGYKSAKDYMIGLTEHFDDKPEYELIRGLDSMEIDKKVAFLSNFKYLKDSKQLSQSYYTADLEDIYLGIVATNSNKETKAEINEIISSIKFK